MKANLLKSISVESQSGLSDKSNFMVENKINFQVTSLYFNLYSKRKSSSNKGQA